MSNQLLLLAAASLPASAWGAEPFQLLRMGQLHCPKQHLPALKTILEASEMTERRAAIDKAIFGGACSVSASGPVQIARIEPGSTARGGSFSCFRMLDAVDQQDLGTYCAASASVASLDEEISARTGDYRVVSESTSLINAECVEGGKLMIFKAHGNWERMSLVFPKTLDPLTRRIPPDREPALRDGCKGVDYR